MKRSPAFQWLATFCAGFAVISALLAWTLFTPPSYGDLTRIGRLSEAAFGWTRPPPPMDPALLRSVPLDQADVLVIGDSFSMTLYWQAELVRAGLKVATTYWGETGYLCGGFDQWLRQQGYKGRLVVIESVERAFDERLRRSEACPAANAGRRLKIRPDPFLGPLARKPVDTLNWGTKLTTGFVTWRNTRRALRSNVDTLHGDETIVRVVPDGCGQFSHPSCGKAPFFKEDVDHGPLTAETFARMQRLTAAQRSFDVLWMVVPNKTTVYVEPDHSKGFVDALRAHPELGPDLFDMAASSRHAVRDFYYPNDTHLSMHGQVALGRVMLEAVRRRLPAAGAPGG